MTGKFYGPLATFIAFFATMFAIVFCVMTVTHDITWQAAALSWNVATACLWLRSFVTETNVD